MAFKMVPVKTILNSETFCTKFALKWPLFLGKEQEIGLKIYNGIAVESGSMGNTHRVSSFTEWTTRCSLIAVLLPNALPQISHLNFFSWRLVGKFTFGFTSIKLTMES